MAANPSGRALAGSLGKRFASQIWAAGNSAAAGVAVPAASRRAVHFASYDKNIEEHVHPAIVPDNVIEARSEKYWGPDPRTGVFGPADPAAVGHGGAQPCSSAAGATSVLDQKVWFRPLEDVEKPPHA